MQLPLHLPFFLVDLVLESEVFVIEIPLHLLCMEDFDDPIAAGRRIIAYD